MNRRVLFVDEDANVLEANRRAVSDRFEVLLAATAEAALRAIERDGPFAAVISGMGLPVMNGLDLLRRVQDVAPQTVRIMLTRNVDQKTAVDAVNDGHVLRFLTKPCLPAKLVETLETAVEQYQLVRAEAELLTRTLTGSINLVMEIYAHIDPAAFRTARQVVELVREVAPRIGNVNMWELELAAMLARIGNLTVPPETIGRFERGEPLTDEESAVLTRVPAIGHDLLSKIPRLGGVSDVVLHQSVRYNGAGGAGDGLTGADLPLGARILKILFDLTELEIAGAPRSTALRTMRNRPGWYDLRLFNTISETLLPATRITMGSDTRAQERRRQARAAAVASKTPTTDRPTRDVQPDVIDIPFSDLMVGDVTARDVVARDGSMLIPARQLITAANLHLLKNYANVKGIVEPIRVFDLDDEAIAA